MSRHLVAFTLVGAFTWIGVAKVLPKQETEQLPFDKPKVGRLLTSSQGSGMSTESPSVKVLKQYRNCDPIIGFRDKFDEPLASNRKLGKSAKRTMRLAECARLLGNVSPLTSEDEQILLRWSRREVIVQEDELLSRFDRLTQERDVMSQIRTKLLTDTDPIKDFLRLNQAMVNRSLRLDRLQQKVGDELGKLRQLRISKQERSRRESTCQESIRLSHVALHAGNFERTIVLARQAERDAIEHGLSTDLIDHLQLLVKRAEIRLAFGRIRKQSPPAQTTNQKITQLALILKRIPAPPTSNEKEIHAALVAELVRLKQTATNDRQRSHVRRKWTSLEAHPDGDVGGIVRIAEEILTEGTRVFSEATISEARQKIRVYVLAYLAKQAGQKRFPWDGLTKEARLKNGGIVSGYFRYNKKPFIDGGEELYIRLYESKESSIQRPGGWRSVKFIDIVGGAPETPFQVRQSRRYNALATSTRHSPDKKVAWQKYLSTCERLSDELATYRKTKGHARIQLSYQGEIKSARTILSAWERIRVLLVGSAADNR